MLNSQLRPNQRKAINHSIENDFSSGVHFHATGTGKSWIALEIILEYNKRYPSSNIIWLCEQKSILIEQLSRSTLRERGYEDVYKTFLVVDYTENKSSKWYEQVNSATFWKKPLLLVINRQFLVSQEKFHKLKLPLHLVIHDECHSVQNDTTQKFYTWIQEQHKDVRCIGFSATPNTDIKPFNNIISSYTIYDAYCDDTIVPPQIKWIESPSPLDDKETVVICKKYIQTLPYRKIIVWCGMIKKCSELVELWRKHFPGFHVSVDTSEDSSGFPEYSEKEKNAILFCASKHREGSDIKNLDCCIFLDKVSNRTSRTFVQCIGRVLRKDKENKKQYGMILDLKASSCIKICDRMNEYLACDSAFPWNYSYDESIFGQKLIIEHELTLKKTIPLDLSQSNFKPEDIEIPSKVIVSKFIRKVPIKQIYRDRLRLELSMLEDKKLHGYLLRAVEILKLTDYIPHVTRGSCGSSLVCYLLGISNVDPIEFNISFARFLNEFRDNLPDIDFDFPHYLRDEVFLKLELEWPNQVARISNHVHWHEKSALREALRKVGINKQIPKEELTDFIQKLPVVTRKEVESYKKQLENTFRHYSLHCGGIVFFHEGVPKELRLNKKTLSQIVYDKNDVAKTKNFKIDILSSRGISQLIGICGKEIDFNNCPFDEDTYNMLKNGNNIGVTLAESPLMRKAMMKIKPKSVHDLAVCLAIIRPAAKETRYAANEIDYQTKFIFDDDAITLLSDYLNIDEAQADKYRRAIAKNSWKKEDKEMFDRLVAELSPQKKKFLMEQVKNLRLYSFCKSHSYSYAQLVYKLAYEKVHNPRKFWASTIKHTCSSYRKWVHLYEAKRAGVNISSIVTRTDGGSIYSESRKKKFSELSTEEQMRRFGYWNMRTAEFYPNCYFYEKDDEYLFSGLIASSRTISSKKPRTMVCFIGVGPGKYIEIITKGKYMNSKHIGVKGRAKMINYEEQTFDAHIVKFY